MLRSPEGGDRFPWAQALRPARFVRSLRLLGVLGGAGDDEGSPASTQVPSSTTSASSSIASCLSKESGDSPFEELVTPTGAATARSGISPSFGSESGRLISRLSGALSPLDGNSPWLPRSPACTAECVAESLDDLARTRHAGAPKAESPMSPCSPMGQLDCCGASPDAARSGGAQSSPVGQLECSTCDIGAANASCRLSAPKLTLAGHSCFDGGRPSRELVRLGSPQQLSAGRLRCLSHDCGIRLGSAGPRPLDHKLLQVDGTFSSRSHVVRSGSSQALAQSGLHADVGLSSRSLVVGYGSPQFAQGFLHCDGSIAARCTRRLTVRDFLQKEPLSSRVSLCSLFGPHLPLRLLVAQAGCGEQSLPYRHMESVIGSRP